MAFTKMHDWDSGGVMASEVSVNTEPFALTDSGTLLMKVGGGAEQTVTFLTADFANIAAATAAEVVAVIDAQTTERLLAAVSTGAVEVKDARDWGVDASIEVTGGTDAAAFAFPAGEVTGTMDGAVRASSTRCGGMQPVRMSDPSGEWFGFEDGGTLVPCVRVQNSAATQAAEDAKQVEVQTGTADYISLMATVDDLTTKRNAGTPLTEADLEAVTDLMIGRQP